MTSREADFLAGVEALAGEIDRQRCIAEAQGHGEALAYLDDLVSRARSLAPPRPAPGEREERLAEALRECSQGVDDKGESCWCRLPGMIPYRGHDTGCEMARAALAPAPEPTMCGECNGEGEVYEQGSLRTTMVPCPACHGKGVK